MGNRHEERVDSTRHSGCGQTLNFVTTGQAKRLAHGEGCYDTKKFLVRYSWQTMRGLAITGSRLLHFRVRVARLGGVAVSIHWSWIPCLVLWIGIGKKDYSTWPYAIGQIVGVFAIVLMHEFGHTVVARRMGQSAPEVILWPLGGLALVDFSHRPKAELLVASAGPLVNVALIPITFLIWQWFARAAGGDLSTLLWRISWANVFILLINLLPIWPLDGGRVVHAAIRNKLGSAKSRLISSIVGLVGAVVGIALCIHLKDFLDIFLLSALVLLDVSSLQWSLAMLAAEKRSSIHAAAICPHCRSRALDEANGTCNCCGNHCNPFMNNGHCWKCAAALGPIQCCYCGEWSQFEAWFPQSPAEINGVAETDKRGTDGQTKTEPVSLDPFV